MTKSGMIKTPAEIRLIAEGGQILAKTLKGAAERVKPGISTASLDAYAEAEIRGLGGVPSFKRYQIGNSVYPASLCVSVNDVVVHGIPSPSQILKEGDLVSLDLGVRYRELFTDAALTVAVGNISKEARKLMEVTEESLALAIAEARPGQKVGDISAAIQTIAEQNGFDVIRDLVGHGVGYAVHEEPNIPCFGKRGTGPTLVPGMVLAIEPMVVAGKWRVTIDPDGWTVRTADGSLAAHFEHTIVITEEGARVLTEVDSG